MTTGLRHHYHPHGAAADIFRSRAPEVLLSGPAGTGKSRAALEKLHAMMLANPGARGLIVRKTLVSLGSTGLVTWREKVAAESIAAGHVQWYGVTTLERTLARALTEVVIRLDLSDDDAITPEATMQVIEPVAVLLQDLSEQDRQALADLIHQLAHQETDPERQLTAWEAPATLGLLPE
jgi:hypothetical protein